MGLGLTVCRTIIRVQRGSLWAENNADGRRELSLRLAAGGVDRSLANSQEEIVTKILTPPATPRPVWKSRASCSRPAWSLSSSIRASRVLRRRRRCPSTTWLTADGIGNEFFPRRAELKLVQLTSAGYDASTSRAALKAKVPVANNGGANSVAVASTP